MPSVDKTIRKTGHDTMLDAAIVRRENGSMSEQPKSIERGSPVCAWDLALRWATALAAHWGLSRDRCGSLSDSWPAV